MPQVSSKQSVYDQQGASFHAGQGHSRAALLDIMEASLCLCLLVGWLESWGNLLMAFSDELQCQLCSWTSIAFFWLNWAKHQLSASHIQRDMGKSFACFILMHNGNLSETFTNLSYEHSWVWLWVREWLQPIRTYDLWVSSSTCCHGGIAVGGLARRWPGMEGPWRRRGPPQRPGEELWGWAAGPPR